MEILGVGLLAIAVAAISIGAMLISKALMCSDCTLKDKCEQSVKNGNGSLCDDKNGPNQFMTTAL